MVGATGPPVMIVPAPVKLRVMPVAPNDPEPVRDGKDPPVTPALARAPPVTANEPPVKLVPEIADVGSFNVPVMLSVPPVSAMVKETLNPEASCVRDGELNVPLPML